MRWHDEEETAKLPRILLIGDSMVDDERYVSGLRDVLTELKGLTDRLVWRNSTPCYTRPDGTENPWTERVPVRNRLAADVVAELGIPTIDCHSVLQDRPELVSDGAHFHPQGYEIIAELICDYLEPGDRTQGGTLAQS